MERLGNPDFKQLTVDFSQLQHMKAFQAGQLRFEQRYHEKPGRLYGVKRATQTMSAHSSFLPFKMPETHFRVNTLAGLGSEQVSDGKMAE